MLRRQLGHIAFKQVLIFTLAVYDMNDPDNYKKQLKQNLSNHAKVLVLLDLVRKIETTIFYLLTLILYDLYFVDFNNCILFFYRTFFNFLFLFLYIPIPISFAKQRSLQYNNFT